MSPVGRPVGWLVGSRVKAEAYTKSYQINDNRATGKGPTLSHTCHLAPDCEVSDNVGVEGLLPSQALNPQV